MEVCKTGRRRSLESWNWGGSDGVLARNWGLVDRVRVFARFRVTLVSREIVGVAAPSRQS